MFIHFALAELRAVDEVRTQNERLDQLLNRLLVAHVGDVGLRQRHISIQILRRWRTFEDFDKQLVDQRGHQFDVRRPGIRTGLLELRFPLGHALADDGVVTITLHAMFENRLVNDLHFFFAGGFIDEPPVLLIVAMLNDLLAPLLHVILQESDSRLNLALVMSEIEPLPLAPFDESVIGIAFLPFK